MKVSLISIGNSRGVRLPKAVLDQCGFSKTAELSIEKGRIVLTPANATRSGWTEAFTAAPQTLSVEDREWLDAALSSADD